MRNSFAECITQMANINNEVVLLSGDIGNKLFDRFKENFSKRFFNCGIAEANMMGVASGLALSGLRPFVYTITPFTTTRCLEQIRVDVCYHNVPVTIVGTGSGFSYAQLGPTHHSCEDVAILRALPGITVFSPCDSIELELGLKASLKLNGPLYIRLGKKGEPIIHNKIQPQDFSFGKSITLQNPNSDDCCLLCMGPITYVALKATDLLAKAGIIARVESLHTVKPLDVTLLEEVFNKYKVVITVEEHSEIGGLRGAIAEWYMSQNKNNNSSRLSSVFSFAVKDEFLYEIGDQNYARQKYGLTPINISNSIIKYFEKLAT